MSDPREGKVLQGRYRLQSMLAEGGMGVVYKAERVGIGRPVVVKFLHAILNDKPGIVDRFEREARATARLNHPHCVALVDFGIDDGSPYLVMEYVEGKTLADLLDHGAVRPERAVAIVRQILAGLEHAHERGILHRDLKPANIMIVDTEGYTGDFVKILDFGLAKLAWPGEDKRDVTVEGIAIGTPGYMSPEQAAGVPSDRRSDIYCTGALLYHLVTGSKAFEGDDVRSILRRHREETPASPRQLQPGVGISKQLEGIIERAMQRDPGKRYQTARDMMAALEGTAEAKIKVDNNAVGVKPPPRPPSSPSGGDSTRAEAPSSRGRARRGRVSPVWIAVGAVVGSVVAVAAIVYSPLGDYVRPHAAVAPGPSPEPSISAKPAASPVPATEPAATSGTATTAAASPDLAPAAGDKTAAATSGTALGTIAPTKATADKTAADGAKTAADKTTEAASPAADKTEPAKAAGEKAAPGPAVANTDGDDDSDPPLTKANDGSNEDDRMPPEPVASAVHDAPAIRNIGDARSLIRRGDSDGALAGLYRLRRSRPTPSASKSSEIAALIGDLYFERKWWTDAMREYRFAIALDGRARKSEPLVSNSVHALADRATYPRARRLILDYVGKGAAPALKRAVKSGPATLRRRAKSVLSTIESRSYRMRR
jgi:eukaryotic-like serine/threonine-protein kinase